MRLTVEQPEMEMIPEEMMKGPAILILTLDGDVTAEIGLGPRNVAFLKTV